MSNKQKICGNLEWNIKEIETFVSEVNTDDGSTLQKKLCSVLSKIAHKRLIDIWVFYQFYIKMVKRDNPINEIETTWNAFRSDKNNMKKLSFKLSDIKALDENYSKQFIVPLSTEDDKTYNDIINKAFTKGNIIIGLELQRINTLLTNNKELTDNQINQLINLKKQYESIE